MKMLLPLVDPCKKEAILVDPALAEALGLRWGIQTAINRGLTDVAFFIDAQGVVNYLNSDPWWLLLKPSSKTISFLG